MSAFSTSVEKNAKSANFESHFSEARSERILGAFGVDFWSIFGGFGDPKSEKKNKKTTLGAPKGGKERSEKHQGYTSEEMKMVWETHKIFNDPSITICPTCVRVPVTNWLEEGCGGLRSLKQYFHILN